MTQYKVVSTVMWKFESDEDEDVCLELAKQKLDAILNSKPHGKDYDGFVIQVNIAPLKDKKRLIHLGTFELDDVFPFITSDDCKHEYEADGKIYHVKMNSDRYHVFKANPTCVACGLTGSKMILDMNPGDQSPHFNLYAEEHGRLVLMTKDHILAKSKGGTDALDNYETCCAICNNLKGAYDLTYDQVRQLRVLYNNEDKVPKKELRDLINNVREEMSIINSAQENQ